MKSLSFKKGSSFPLWKPGCGPCSSRNKCITCRHPFKPLLCAFVLVKCQIKYLVKEIKKIKNKNQHPQTQIPWGIYTNSLHRQRILKRCNFSHYNNNNSRNRVIISTELWWCTWGVKSVLIIQKSHVEQCMWLSWQYCDMRWDLLFWCFAGMLLHCVTVIIISEKRANLTIYLFLKQFVSSVLKWMMVWLGVCICVVSEVKCHFVLVIFQSSD